MKHWTEWSHRTLLKVCYGLGCVVLAASMLLHFAVDSVSYATGRLHHQVLTLADTDLYTLVDLAWDGADTLTAQTGDVQLLLQPGQPVRNLRLYATYSTQAGYERDLYWHLPGQGYSRRHRVWPTAGPDGSWDYTLPLLAGKGLRLDLADQSGVDICVQAVEINRRPAWYTYLIPTLWQLAWLAAVPGLLACAAALLQDGIRKIRLSKKGGPKA